MVQWRYRLNGIIADSVCICKSNAWWGERAKYAGNHVVQYNHCYLFHDSFQMYRNLPVVYLRELEMFPFRDPVKRGYRKLECTSIFLLSSTRKDAIYDIRDGPQFYVYFRKPVTSGFNWFTLHVAVNLILPVLAHGLTSIYSGDLSDGVYLLIFANTPGTIHAFAGLSAVFLCTAAAFRGNLRHLKSAPDGFTHLGRFYV